MAMSQRAVEPTRNTFSVNEKKLRKYSEHYPDPAVQFERGSTKVIVDDDEHLTITGTMDESVHMHIEGKRTFQGVAFDLKDLQIVGLKKPESDVYFIAIMRHLLAAFEDGLCDCGGLVACHCKEE